MKSRFFLISLIFFIIACDQIGGEGSDEGNIIRDKEGKIVSGTVKQYTPGKVLKAIRNVKDYKLDGKSTLFHNDGKTVKSEIFYKMGKKEGEAKSYYSDGTLYRVFHYKNDKLEGEQTKYRQNGQVRSIAYYRDGEPNNQLKEYLTNGSLKKKYPRIVVETIDKTLLTGEYIVRVRMSDRSKNVTYYLGQLDKDGFVSSEAIFMGKRSNGILDIKYTVFPGQYLVEKLELIAKVKTFQNNYYLTTKTYNVAFENRVQ